MEERLIELPYMDLHRTMRALSDGGADAALARAIRQSDGGARAVRAMRAELLGVGAQPAPGIDRKLVHGLWTPPAEQIMQVRRWNDLFHWGFRPEAFAVLEQTIPQQSDLPLTAITIEICLPKGNGVNAIQRTFEELWRIVAMRQDRHERWMQMRSDAKHLKLLDGVRHRPGIRWVRDDMGANCDHKNGIAPRLVRQPILSPHASILSAAALHPAWVRAMDGFNIPYVWISGYVMTFDGYGTWSYVPILYNYRDLHTCEVNLNADAADRSFQDYAVPVHMEV